ncbi:HTH domain-containing protein [Halorarius litoreus]|uniref:HTH domain-containing protein n=1 Tax=Halorarius litoreus TaxID=2962676 RepID=UPI0020CC04CF|nr:HTH domain-containing protein [Halorarius litoreus]
MRDETATNRTADLFMEASESTLGRRRAVVARLEELQSNGWLDRFSVRTWPSRVTLEGPNEDVVSVVHRLERWADEAGVSLGPCFEWREYDCTFTDESGELVSLPVVALAVYEDDDLVDVAPRVETSTVVTVDELLDELGQRADTGRRPAVVDELS